MPNYPSWKEKRADELGVKDNPNLWFYLEHPTHADWYNIPTALAFTDAARKYGIDPFDYLALGISESGLGNKDPGNPSRIFWSKHPSLQSALSPTGMMPMEEDARQLAIDFGAKYLAEQFRKYPEDRLKALQNYSGKGSTIYGGHPDTVQYNLDSTKVFGRPYQKINFAKEKPQGKRIAQLSDLLKITPEVMPIVFPQNDIFSLQPPKTVLGAKEEAEFQKWYKKYAEGSKLNPNPDDPRHYYDYRGAWKAGIRPKLPIKVRNPSTSELDYFKKNPHVSGMAAEDNAVILNPYSKLSDQEKKAVTVNEQARIKMRTSGNRPSFALTEEQRKQFAGYGRDQDIKETIAGRILSGDPSTGNATAEQKKWVNDHLLKDESHFPDTYKLPGHPTFSTESIYYKPGMKAGRWEGERYIPISPSLAMSGEQPAVPIGESGIINPFILSLLDYLGR